MFHVSAIYFSSFQVSCFLRQISSKLGQIFVWFCQDLRYCNLSTLIWTRKHTRECSVLKFLWWSVCSYLVHFSRVCGILQCLLVVAGDLTSWRFIYPGFNCLCYHGLSSQGCQRSVGCHVCHAALAGRARSAGQPQPFQVLIFPGPFDWSDLLVAVADDVVHQKSRLWISHEWAS